MKRVKSPLTLKTARNVLEGKETSCERPGCDFKGVYWGFKKEKKGKKITMNELPFI